VSEQAITSVNEGNITLGIQREGDNVVVGHSDSDSFEGGARFESNSNSNLKSGSDVIVGVGQLIGKKQDMGSALEGSGLSRPINGVHPWAERLWGL